MLAQALACGPLRQQLPGLFAAVFGSISLRISFGANAHFSSGLSVAQSGSRFPGFSGYFPGIIGKNSGLYPTFHLTIMVHFHEGSIYRGALRHRGDLLWCSAHNSWQPLR
jgi:hypothetical protein